MKEFVRNVFTGEDVLNLSTRAVIANPVYAQALRITTESSVFTTVGLLAAMELALGERVTQLFVTIDVESTIDIAAHVMEDFVCYEDRNPKDLQVNLVVNIIKEMIDSKNVHTAARCGAAEDIIRRCGFDADFKYVLKCALFDNRAVHSAHIVIAHYPPNVTPTSTGSRAQW